MLFATTWMDLEGIIFNEIIERQRKTSTVSYHFYAESKKKKQVNMTKQKQTYRNGKQSSGYQ